MKKNEKEKKKISLQLVDLGSSEIAHSVLTLLLPIILLVQML